MNADAGGQPDARLLDALEVAVVVFDLDGKVVLANRRARDDLAVIGESIDDDGAFTYSFELVDEHGELLPTAELPSVRTLRTGEVLTNFVMGLRSSGRGTVWVMVGTSPVSADDGSDHRGDLHVLRHHRAAQRADRHCARRRSGSGSWPRTRPTWCTRSRWARRRSSST